MFPSHKGSRGSKFATRLCHCELMMGDMIFRDIISHRVTHIIPLSVLGNHLFRLVSTEGRRSNYSRDSQMSLYCGGFRDTSTNTIFRGKQVSLRVPKGPTRAQKLQQMIQQMKRRGREGKDGKQAPGITAQAQRKSGEVEKTRWQRMAPRETIRHVSRHQP